MSQEIFNTAEGQIDGKSLEKRIRHFSNDGFYSENMGDLIKAYENGTLNQAEEKLKSIRDESQISDNLRKLSIELLFLVDILRNNEGGANALKEIFNVINESRNQRAKIVKEITGKRDIKVVKIPPKKIIKRIKKNEPVVVNTGKKEPTPIEDVPRDITIDPINEFRSLILSRELNSLGKTYGIDLSSINTPEIKQKLYEELMIVFRDIEGYKVGSERKLKKLRENWSFGVENGKDENFYKEMIVRDKIVRRITILVEALSTIRGETLEINGGKVNKKDYDELKSGFKEIDSANGLDVFEQLQKNIRRGIVTGLNFNTINLKQIVIDNFKSRNIPFNDTIYDRYEKIYGDFLKKYMIFEGGSRTLNQYKGKGFGFNGMSKYLIDYTDLEKAYSEKIANIDKMGIADMVITLRMLAQMIPIAGDALGINDGFESIDAGIDEQGNILTGIDKAGIAVGSILGILVIPGIIKKLTNLNKIRLAVQTVGKIANKLKASKNIGEFAKNEKLMSFLNSIKNIFPSVGDLLNTIISKSKEIKIINTKAKKPETIAKISGNTDLSTKIIKGILGDNFNINKIGSKKLELLRELKEGINEEGGINRMKEFLADIKAEDIIKKLGISRETLGEKNYKILLEKIINGNVEEIKKLTQKIKQKFIIQIEEGLLKSGINPELMKSSEFEKIRDAMISKDPNKIKKAIDEFKNKSIKEIVDYLGKLKIDPDKVSDDDKLLISANIKRFEDDDDIENLNEYLNNKYKEIPKLFGKNIEKKVLEEYPDLDKMIKEIEINKLSKDDIWNIFISLESGIENFYQIIKNIHSRQVIIPKLLKDLGLPDNILLSKKEISIMLYEKGSENFDKLVEFLKASHITIPNILKEKGLYRPFSRLQFDSGNILDYINKNDVDGVLNLLSKGTSELSDIADSLRTNRGIEWLKNSSSDVIISTIKDLINGKITLSEFKSFNVLKTIHGDKIGEVGNINIKGALKLSELSVDFLNDLEKLGNGIPRIIEMPNGEFISILKAGTTSDGKVILTIRYGIDKEKSSLNLPKFLGISTITIGEHGIESGELVAKVIERLEDGRLYENTGKYDKFKEALSQLLSKFSTDLNKEITEGSNLEVLPKKLLAKAISDSFPETTIVKAGKNHKGHDVLITTVRNKDGSGGQFEMNLFEEGGKNVIYIGAMAKNGSGKMENSLLGIIPRIKDITDLFPNPRLMPEIRFVRYNDEGNLVEKFSSTLVDALDRRFIGNKTIKEAVKKVIKYYYK